LEKKSKLIYNILQTIIVISFIVNIFYYFHIPKRVVGLAVRPNYIQKYINESKKIGMAQSGISGFFFDNIINLDGKVNFQAMKAIKANNLYQYINKEKIDVLIEWNEWFFLLNKDSLDFQWKSDPQFIENGKTRIFTRL
jgi:hypothetical protein